MERNRTETETEVREAPSSVGGRKKRVERQERAGKANQTLRNREKECTSLAVKHCTHPPDIKYANTRDSHLDRNNVNTTAKTQTYEYKNTCTIDFVIHRQFLVCRSFFSGGQRQIPLLQDSVNPC